MGKQTLILAPGLLCDESLWQQQIKELADLADCRVADTTQDDSMEAMAARLLEEAPGEFALAGLSMGGYLVQEVMRQAPERVTRLALLDTNPYADPPAQSKVRKDLIAKAEEGFFGEIIPGMLPRLIHPDRLNDESLVGTVKSMAEAIGPQAFVKQQKAIMGRADGREDLKKISCPTLVLCGAEDALTPPDIHRDMAENIPGAKFVTVADCGHLSPIERPGAVTVALKDWLQG